MLDWIGLCRASPASFACVASSGGLKYAKHWRAIDRALLRVANGTCKRLAINIPPQFGKSELASKHFPAWFLGNYPDKKIILASYESDYAASWGRKARDVFAEYATPVWGLSLGATLTRSDWWETSQGGYMATAGIRAGITGKGAHVFIVDDPHKNAEEAHSQVIRDRIWEEYKGTFLTRLQPEGAIIIIQTRWHEDDLTGRLFKNEGDQWEKIILPALDENNESLFPERYSAEELLNRRESMGSYMFDALYQQTPTPKEGGMFKRHWLRYYDRLPEKFDRIIQSWDLTFGDTGDSYVVGLILGKIKADTYVIDMFRDKWAFPDQLKMIQIACEKYPRATRKLIERKANGQATIDMLKKSMPGIIPIDPKESKEARASAISYVIESGNFYVPSYGEIKKVAEAELFSFPNGVTDDFVDAMSQGLSNLYTKGQISTASGEDL